MAHNYDVGTKAWQPDPKEGWVASELTQKLEDGDKVKLIFSLESGEVSVECFCRTAFRSLHQRI